MICQMWRTGREDQMCDGEQCHGPASPSLISLRGPEASTEEADDRLESVQGLVFQTDDV